MATRAVPNHRHPRVRFPKADPGRPGSTRGRLRLLGPALAAALVTVNCGATDRPLLEQFFSASRLRDLTALQSIATTTFEPTRDGIVRTFRVVGADGVQQVAAAFERHVTVDAAVMLPDGTEVEKALVVTLRAEGIVAQSGQTGWRVMAVQ